MSAPSQGGAGHARLQCVDGGAIACASIRVAGMVMLDSVLPIPMAPAQILEELSGIGRVFRGLERLFQTVEGVAVIDQIDLHAADVDVADAASLQRPDLFDRGVPAGRYRPRPSAMTVHGQAKLAFSAVSQRPVSRSEIAPNRSAGSPSRRSMSFATAKQV